MSTTTNLRSRKVLVPLATMLAAGAIAVGSGATFTSQSDNTGNAYTMGTLTQTNNKSGSALFDLDNLKPGDSLSNTVTITNSGSLPATMSLSVTTSTNTFVDKDELTLSVKEGGTSVVDPTELDSITGEALPSTTGGRSPWAKDESHTYTVTVSLDSSAGNENQGKTVAAALTWNGVQQDGTTYSGTAALS